MRDSNPRGVAPNTLPTLLATVHPGLGSYVTSLDVLRAVLVPISIL